MDNSLANIYSFRHKSGRIVIANSYAEFCFMQGVNAPYDLKDKVDGPYWSKNVRPYLMTEEKDGKVRWDKDWWGGQENRLAYRKYRGCPSPTQYAIEEKINKFWSAAEPYAILKNKIRTGYNGCPLIKFLTNIHNHACMVGDNELYKKVNASLQVFQGNQLFLPQSC